MIQLWSSGYWSVLLYLLSVMLGGTLGISALGHALDGRRRMAQLEAFLSSGCLGAAVIFWHLSRLPTLGG